MLHTISSSLTYLDVSALMNVLDDHSEILLLQDGVLSAVAQSEANKVLAAFHSPIYALSDDVLARGLQDKMAANIVLINYQDFVDLTIKHQQQMAW